MKKTVTRSDMLEIFLKIKKKQLSGMKRLNFLLNVKWINMAIYYVGHHQAYRRQHSFNTSRVFVLFYCLENVFVHGASHI